MVSASRDQYLYFNPIYVIVLTETEKKIFSIFLSDIYRERIEMQNRNTVRDLVAAKRNFNLNESWLRPKFYTKSDGVEWCHPYKLEVCIVFIFL